MKASEILRKFESAEDNLERALERTRQARDELQEIKADAIELIKEHGPIHYSDVTYMIETGDEGDPVLVVIPVKCAYDLERKVEDFSEEDV